jgi:transposase InsO family protein/predicted DNA-binding transcriptional regulator AlpA
MSGAARAEVIEKVKASVLPVKKILAELGVPRSTYYRWIKKKPPSTPGPGRVPWNRLSALEEESALEVARASPEWSSRQVAAWVTDNTEFSVSEASVYRLLKREGLVRRLVLPDPASDEYRFKTKRPHQLWATDASYFRVAGWGYYYMVTVMDDYSRFILAWRLQVDMTSPSLIDVVQDAVDRTGMTGVQVQDRTKLLSDNGSGYISKAFQEYVQLVGIQHIFAAPYHPQTNGKLERYHQTLKRSVNQVPYDVPMDLQRSIEKFVEFYNYRRYHKALKDVTPSDMLAGRRDQILARRKEAKDRSSQRRREHNKTLREQLRSA